MTTATELASATGALRRYYLRIGGHDTVLWQRVAGPDGIDTPGYLIDAYRVGWWRLDESSASDGAIDSSGNAHDMTSVGSPGVVDGRIAGARGTNFAETVYFVLANHADFHLQTLSLAGWAYSTSTKTDWHKILVKGNTDPSNTWSIGTDGDGSNAPSFVIGFTDASELKLNGANGTFTEDAWHHVVGTWDGTTAKLYFDGALIDTDATGAGKTVRYDTNAMVIGNDDDGIARANQYWEGRLDDVSVFNVALTASQVAELYRGSLNCLHPPSQEFSTSLDLATMRTEASSLEIELDDIDDPTDPGKSYFGKLFAPARWKATGSKVTYHKRAALATTQLDANAATITCVKNDDFDNMPTSGELYTAQETFSHTGVNTQATTTTNGYPAETLGTFTGCTRGLYPAFDAPRPGETTWANTIEYPRTLVAADSGDMAGNVAISDVPFSWVGRAVGLYVSCFDYDLNEWGDGVLVWPGRIADSITYRPSSGTWILTCDSIMADLDRKLCNHLPEVEPQLINLSGQLGRRAIATLWSTAADATQVYAYREIDIPAGYYSRGNLQREIVTQLNDSWTLAGGGAYAPVETWSAFDTDGKMTLRIDYSAKDGKRAYTIYPSLRQGAAIDAVTAGDPDFASLGTYPCHGFMALGWRSNATIELQPDAEGCAEVTAEHEGYRTYHPMDVRCNGAEMFVKENGTDYLWETQGDYEAVGGGAWATITTEDVRSQPGGEKTRGFVSYTARALAAKTILPAAAVQRDGTELTLADAEHQTQTSIPISAFAGDAKFKQCWQPKYLDNKRVPIGPFRQLLPPLISSGTTDYNKANWDNCPPALSCNIPYVLLNPSSFLRADAAVTAAYPQLSRRPITFWEEPVSFAEAFEREGSIFGYCLSLDAGIIVCKPVFGADLRDATVTLNESNTSTPKDFPEISMSAGTVVNQVTVQCNHRLTDGKSQPIIVRDNVSIDGLGGIVKEVKFDHPGIQAVGDGRLDVATAELTTLLMQRAALLRYPSQRIRRTLAPTLLKKIFVGDTVNVVYSAGFQDPTGTGDRNVNTIAIVLDCAWNFAEGPGSADLLLYSRYDATNATPWAPSALVDRSVANAGWDSGNKRLTLEAHAFGDSSTDDHDGEAFDVDGYKIILVERAPSDPTTVTPISATVASSAYDTANQWLYIDEDISVSFDTTGATEYVVLFADWATAVTAQQSLGTWQAGIVDHLLNSTDSAQYYG
jgi:hypothetical protein